ncbi:hypothetical protein TG4357_02271 [Thalassovita gelatinovora]|uniref:Uncharacterized protein n=1 Tax=Thalassovita gelatinovora TaxID=53501 RepID=A0A0P1G0H4_THAGE|nr:hypothetical protein TG4357_02271 [Thalassovita gelatinovora]
MIARTGFDGGAQIPIGNLAQHVLRIGGFAPKLPIDPANNHDCCNRSDKNHRDKRTDLNLRTKRIGFRDTRLCCVHADFQPLNQSCELCICCPAGCRGPTVADLECGVIPILTSFFQRRLD